MWCKGSTKKENLLLEGIVDVVSTPAWKAGDRLTPVRVRLSYLPPYKSSLSSYTGEHRVTLKSTIRVKVARKMGYRRFKHYREPLYGRLI